jgi:flagellar motility protein MotE (MotC chaperone)
MNRRALVSNIKDNLKERVLQRSKEAEEIKRVHEELKALRDLHKQENEKFATERANLLEKK